MYYMLAKKVTSSSHDPLWPNQGYRKELDNLYARISAIDALIQSLENYDRSVPSPSSDSRLHTV